MLHAPPTVKGVLVQAPLDCVAGSSTCTVPVAGGTVPPAEEAVVGGALVEGASPDDAVVVEEFGPSDVVVADELCPEEPAGGGGVYPLVAGFGVAPPPPELPMTIPIRSAMATATMSCHVLHDRRCLMPSAPGGGTSLAPASVDTQSVAPFSEGLPGETVDCSGANTTVAG
jgi:hypothetical protein